jgi:AbrB family looped-hinge helix DNA binding protein
MKNAIRSATTPSTDVVRKQAITVDSAGRIVLPSAVRRRLNLTAGSRLTLDVVAQRIELTPEADADDGLLIVPGQRTVLRPTGQAFDAAAVVRAERDAQANAKTRR